eukprot:6206860-Pleurochrysis_carterae.AAC.1
MNAACTSSMCCYHHTLWQHQLLYLGLFMGVHATCTERPQATLRLPSTNPPPKPPAVAATPLPQVRTRTQQRALLALNQYVIGAYEETADAIADMHWKQLNKLRELCDAAQEVRSAFEAH